MYQDYSQVMLDGSLEQFSLTWPKWGTLLDGLLTEQLTWVRYIDETESLLWLTPSTVAIEGKEDRVEKVGYPIREKGSKSRKGEKMIPTPAMRDYKGAVKGRHPGSKTYHANLDEYVNTPEQRNSGQLNADWVSLLMGFPADWTVIGETDGKTEPHE
jgi:hypothetical protein